LENTGGGSTGSTLGQGRGEDQCSDPRTQVEEKYHTDPRTHKVDARVEEDACRTHHCVNIETRATGSNRTVIGMGIRSTHIGKSG
jgi:hypothetical protein